MTTERRQPPPDNPERHEPGEPRAARALLLTTEEAADVLRIGRTTVYALIKTGHLRPVHIGRSCRITRAELERFVSRLDAPLPARRLRAAGLPRTTVDQLKLSTTIAGRPSEGSGTLPGTTEDGDH